MKKVKKLTAVKSVFNNDVYFTCEDFPSKVIDGKEFIGVVKSEMDTKVFYMMRENLEIILT